MFLSQSPWICNLQKETTGHFATFKETTGHFKEAISELLCLAARTITMIPLYFFTSYIKLKAAILMLPIHLKDKLECQHLRYANR